MKRLYLIASFILTGTALPLSAQQFIFKNYTVQDGLVANPVRRIFQDAKGFIWIVTWEGLSKYDGHKFTNYNTANGLSHDLVNDVLEIDNKIYVAQNNGVVDVIQPQVLNPKSIGEKLVVNKFHTVKRGKILVATDGNGICEFSKEHFVKPPQARPSSNYDGLDDFNDSLLLGFEKGRGLLRLHTMDYRLLAEIKVGTDLTCTYKDSKKRIWVGTAKGLKLLLPFTTNRQSLAFRSLPKQFAIPLLQNAYITEMLETSNGDFWIGTTQALIRFKRDGSSYLLTKSDGLPSESISCIFEDKEKNVWIGTSLGLSKIVTANRIEIYSTKNGMSSDIVGDMALLKSGNLLLVTSRGVQHFNLSSGRFTNITSNFDFSQYVFLQNADPFLLYSNNKVGEYDSIRQRIVTKNIPPLNSYYLTSDTDQNFFSATENGLLIYSKKTGETNHLLTSRITSLLLEKNGLIWVGTWQNGFYRIKYAIVNGKLTFAVKKFTELNSAKHIRSLFKDSRANIWIGTRYNGVFRLSKKNNDDYEVMHISQEEGLNSNWVVSFAEGKEGSMWIGTRIGLDKLVFHNNKARVFNFSRTINFFGHISGIIPTTGNSIWCLADAKLVQFSDEQLEDYLPLPVYITSVVLADGRQNKSRLKTDTTISLKHYQNQLHFAFSAPSFINEKQVLYSYRLSGSADPAWSQPQNIHEVSYASLQPGAYVFEVRTIGWNGEPGEPSFFSFTIMPPFWKTWWFITLCALIGSVLFYFVYRYRIAQIMKLQKVRNRIATDLHDDIGSTLTNISILSELSTKKFNEDPQQAKNYLHRISEEINESGQALDDIIWSVNSKNDTPEEMLVRMRRFAAELFDSSNVSCRLELKETFAGRKMNMEQRRDVYLIYKESLNNIYKHAKAQKVHVELKMNKNSLTLTISDDGKGFDPQLVTERNGLKNLKVRVEKWKGDLSISSRPETGSAIRVTMPVKD